MPGQLLSLTPSAAIGWAVHPRLADYRVLVHVAHRSTIARSVIAETHLTGDQTGAAAISCGFRIDLTTLDLRPADLSRLRFGIGETDEWIEPPPGGRQQQTGKLTVEDLMVRAHGTRSWVTGATYLDAAAAGLRVETIIDMLYRDYLGRPSDPHGLAHYTESARAGATTYDDIRRAFVATDEYHLRRKYVDSAPGRIFSQAIVMAGAAEDSGQRAAPLTTTTSVPAAELLRLDGPEFVTELYRRVLLKEPDEGGMAHYLHQLHLGTAKTAIIRRIASELEAITAGVRVVGYPEETG